MNTKINNTDLIIEGIKNGDNNQILNLINLYKKGVYRIIYKIIGNRDDAEDLTKDVFLKFIQKIDNFQKCNKIKNYIYRIAANKSINFMRRKKIINFVSLFGKDSHDVELLDKIHDNNKNNPENGYDEKYYGKLINYAIGKLNNRQKKVFILKEYENLSYKDISEITNYSISSIESLLFRARKKIKEIISQEM